MRKRRLILAAALIALAAVAIGVVRVWGAPGELLALFHGPTKPTLAPAPPPVPVVAGTVTSHDVPIYLRGVGTVIAYNNVIMRSQITGEITQIAFTQGQKVGNGD